MQQGFSDHGPVRLPSDGAHPEKRSATRVRGGDWQPRATGSSHNQTGDEVCRKALSVIHGHDFWLIVSATVNGRPTGD